MQLKMYSIRDAKAETYGQPFMSQTHGEAERNFKRLANDPQSNVSQFPEDFDLYHLGEYDTNTGKITALQTPSHLIKAIDTKTVQ